MKMFHLFSFKNIIYLIYLCLYVLVLVCVGMHTCVYMFSTQFLRQKLCLDLGLTFNWDENEQAPEIFLSLPSSGTRVKGVHGMPI